MAKFPLFVWRASAVRVGVCFAEIWHDRATLTTDQKREVPTLAKIEISPELAAVGLDQLMKLIPAPEGFTLSKPKFEPIVDRNVSPFHIPVEPQSSGEQET